MIFKKFLFFILLFTFSLVCASQNAETKRPPFLHSVRVEVLDENKVIFIGAASSVLFDFNGDFCFILLQSAVDHQNYVSLERHRSIKSF